MTHSKSNSFSIFENKEHIKVLKGNQNSDNSAAADFKKIF